MQIQTNRRDERHASDSAYLASRSPLARSLEKQHQVAAYLGGEAADRRRAFVHICAELMFSAKCVDPRVQQNGRIKSTDSIWARCQSPVLLFIRSWTSSESAQFFNARATATNWSTEFAAHLIARNDSSRCSEGEPRSLRVDSDLRWAVVAPRRLFQLTFGVDFHDRAIRCGGPAVPALRHVQDRFGRDRSVPGRTPPWLQQPLATGADGHRARAGRGSASVHRGSRPDRGFMRPVWCLRPAVPLRDGVAPAGGDAGTARPRGCPPCCRGGSAAAAGRPPGGRAGRGSGLCAGDQRPCRSGGLR